MAGLGERVTLALGDDGGAFALTFAGGGQHSVDRLVNQLVENVETLCESRLSTVLAMDSVHRLQPSDVEGFASGSSRDLALALLGATERLYRGGKRGGLGNLVRATTASAHEHLCSLFESAGNALRAMTGPLERAVQSERHKLEVASKATKALEIAVKTELASALGVTMTFTSGDGD